MKRTKYLFQFIYVPFEISDNVDIKLVPFNFVWSSSDGANILAAIPLLFVEL